MRAPSHSPLLDPFDVTITITSHQGTLERVRVNVVANDAFLVTGPTLTVLEVA